MADISGVIFFTQLLGLVVLFVFRLYNVVKTGDLYKIDLSFISFILSGIFFYMGFSVVMVDNNTALYSIIFNIETLLFILTVLGFIIEIIFNYKNLMPGMRRNSKEHYRKHGIDNGE